jgi:hypothetical protein
VTVQCSRTNRIWNRLADHIRAADDDGVQTDEVVAGSLQYPDGGLCTGRQEALKSKAS